MTEQTLREYARLCWERITQHKRPSWHEDMRRIADALPDVTGASLWISAEYLEDHALDGAWADGWDNTRGTAREDHANAAKTAKLEERLALVAWLQSHGEDALLLSERTARAMNDWQRAGRLQSWDSYFGAYCNTILKDEVTK
jgi:hypothetical protein